MDETAKVVVVNPGEIKVEFAEERDRWEAVYQFSMELTQIVKAAGFKFDGRLKKWWTRDEAIAAKLAIGDIADIVQRLNAERERKEKAIAASRAVDADIKIPVPKGLRPDGFQRAGVAFILRRFKGLNHVLLGDEMGLGKTIEALCVINAADSLRKVLVICMASHKLLWAKEAWKWLVRPRADLPIYIDDGMFPYVRWVQGVTPTGVTASAVELKRFFDLERGGVVITNYESVVQDREALKYAEWDLLIVDECQAIKNPEALRSKAILGWYDKDPNERIAPLKAKHKLFMTGTPITNRPKELWGLVRELDPYGLGKNWRDFVRRYCNASWNGKWWDTSGASHLDELQERLRSGPMLRRLKAEVLTDLPPKRRQVFTLTPEGDILKQAIEDEQKMIRHSSNERLNGLIEKLAGLKEDDRSYEQVATELERAAKVSFSETSSVRHDIAKAKVPQVLVHCKTVLEGQPKLVVFAWHHDVIEELAVGLAEYGVLTMFGDISLKKREEVKTVFQTDATKRVIVGSIPVMGTGWTLTAATTVVFAEIDWVPGNMSQAEDRLHRRGQLGNVTVQHIQLEGTLDDKIAAVLVWKQSVIERALDRGREKLEVLQIPK